MKPKNLVRDLFPCPARRLRAFACPLSTLLCLLLLLSTVTALAGAVNLEQDAVRLLIEETAVLVKSKNAEMPAFVKASQRLETTLEAVRSCAENGKEELDKVSGSLAELGPQEEDEASAVRQQRKKLRAAKQEKQQQLTQCNLFAGQIEELLNTVRERRMRLATLNILNKQDDLIGVISALPTRGSEWWAELGPLFQRQSGLDGLSLFVISLGGVLMVASVLLSLWLRKAVLAVLARHPHPIVRAMVHSLSHYLHVLLPVLTLAIFAQLVTSQRPSPAYVAALAYSVGLYLVLRLLIRFFLKPGGHDQPLLPLPPKLASSFERYLTWSALILSLHIFLVSTDLVHQADGPPFLFIRDAMVTLLCLLWIRLCWLFVQVPGRERSGQWLRLLLAPILGAALITAWLGYHNLSEYILTNSLKTIGGILLYFFAKYLLASTLKSLSYGGAGWPARIREKFGLGAQEVGTSFLWLHVLLDLLCLVLLLLYIISCWSISQTLFSQAVDLLAKGFTIGQIPIVPGRIFFGVFLFFFFWTLSLGGKTVVKRSLASNSHLTTSTRDATVTLTGYLGFFIALLLGGAAAGMNFTSLTVIAGALSVGIGFGLQNIVNNFVSGLILIFERPIQRGDWIVVGPTEGYVSEISVRSTVIRTFDRAEVIVPNSELISGQVTNWMLSDRKGRVRIPIGVAYGSDLDLVKRLLLEAVHAHPEVITSGEDLEPRVLFMEFGDSSLNLELRCFVQEIDKRLFCRSDLNFAIDKAFREHQVVIPFPQRDVNVKGEGGGARASVKHCA